MGIWDRFFPQRRNEIWADIVPDMYGVNWEVKASSKVSDINYQGYKFVIQPEVDFKQAYEYYFTIGKVQNVVDSIIAEVLSRDFYFEGAASGVKAMEDWAEQFNLNRILECTLRDWLVCGNNILGTTDWEPVQMDNVIGLKRDEYGKVQEYVYSVNGRWEKLPLRVDQYIHSKFIEANRRPWGHGLFYSLMTTFSWHGTTSLPMLEIYRRHMQNLAKIEEKYASPIVVWAYENISEEAYIKQKEALKAMKPGDRRVTNKLPTLLTETIDSRGSLIQVLTDIVDKEVEAGLQSSAIRLITEPSAMADAREANEKDDSRLLGIMNRLRTLMNKQIIPLVTNSKVEFLWGSQDEFDTEMPPGLADAINLKLVGVKEGREILRAQGWKLDDALYDQEQEENELKQQQQFDQQMQMKDADPKKNGFPPKAGDDEDDK